MPNRPSWSSSWKETKTTRCLRTEAPFQACRTGLFSLLFQDCLYTSKGHVPASGLVSTLQVDGVCVVLNLLGPKPQSSAHRLTHGVNAISARGDAAPDASGALSAPSSLNE